MIYVALLLNCICIVITVFVVLRENSKKIVPLFSLRNVFLFGFLYFQSFGFFSWLLDRDSQGWWSFLVSDENYETSVYYGVCLNIFLIVFLVTYRFFKFKAKPEKKIRELEPVQLFQLAIIMTLIAIAVWFLGRFGFRDLMRFISSGIGVTATGFAAWAWTSRVKNPAFILLVFAIAMVNLTPHLTDYGRRGIVSIAAIVAWVLYYRVSFRFNPVKLGVVTVLIAIPMLFVIAAFSEARVRRPESTVQAVQYMLKADINRGMRRLATFQGSAPISMWCMEHHPSPHRYRHCHSAAAFFFFFVPRSIWPEKPDGLGKSIPRLAGLKRVGGLNVGAGLTGHAFAEGGLYALVLYAVLIAILLKTIDIFIVVKISAIYRIPLAAGLGDLFATARGEVNFFLDIMMISIVSGLLVAMVLTRFLYGRIKI